MSNVHEMIDAYVSQTMGRRRLALGPIGDEIANLAVGLADQLSAYHEVHPTRRVRVHRAVIREGQERAYLFVALRVGRRRPLRLQAALAGWDQPCDSSNPLDFVWAVNARRWRWLDRSRLFIERLFVTIADAVLAYYERRPYARLVPAPDRTTRIVEGVDDTFVVVEFDDRSPASTKESQTRHRLQ